ncbi:hypothetical protein [Xylophilus sp.]|uniref:hypothetical protein n=1 Tax=Xylophilus sp. TaxID=2653893 RepID=UPI0013B7D1AF|nr:hypothetical protein [Xylophilus sp.]KAF1043616.1 MAG: hypothetical protein GAK38_03877 [Xylophilus sp.]
MTGRLVDGRAARRGACGPADLVGGLIRFALRLAALAAGLLFALSLLAAVLLLAAAWGVRALWARITGRPVAPWAVRIDPRQGWERAFRPAGRFAARGADDTGVIDVQPKERGPAGR